MSKHFHGTRHIKGGFDMDTNTIPANSLYWYSSADDQLCRLQELVGDEKGRNLTAGINGSWREIYESIKILTDLAEKQLAEAQKLANEMKPAFDNILSAVGQAYSPKIQFVPNSQKLQREFCIEHYQGLINRSTDPANTEYFRKQIAELQPAIDDEIPYGLSFRETEL